MPDTQYALFRDLDRHFVTGGLQHADCCAAVRQKRASIESELNRNNPVVRDVLEGRTTFAAIYLSHSSEFRGLRRFLPKAHDPVRNEQLAHFGRIVPNARHFLRRSVLAADNPITCACYGILAACAVGFVWAYSTRDDADAIAGAGASFDVGLLLSLAVLGGVAGFALGLIAMLRYRTRDQNSIHAREAAAYMDLNYQCFRAGDDAAWARIIEAKSAVAVAHVTSPPAQPAAHTPATT